MHSKETREKISLAKRKFFANGGVGSRKGKHCSEKHKRKIGMANKIAMRKYLDNGGIPSRKGTKCSLKTKLKLRKFNVGKKLSEETKNKIRLSTIGEKGNNWKGDKVGYSGIHMRNLKEWGNPMTCKKCGKKGKIVNGKWNIHWANIDHKYRWRKKDWLGLCKFCHIEHDKKLIK